MRGFIEMSFLRSSPVALISIEILKATAEMRRNQHHKGIRSAIKNRLLDDVFRSHCHMGIDGRVPSPAFDFAIDMGRTAQLRCDMACHPGDTLALRTRRGT
ncbi:uncharacterized protein LAESUDRAFT_104569 [Laetiporus sulphureus 93-53]|uniref:Uncharacterized protein n=1 Tax=Laetiporus sulphureus 93-53 TaxID=1314785 RepID=A0A165ETU8_9APHY|nr:uncharacterized protein LAESUDRAFT_104569 [Laetiporus sulphureus 93-53]KZT07748.1 hypothetical protein LAESUDRAFT_104569 [Laetiporus sulphureus 93-53]